MQYSNNFLRTAYPKILKNQNEKTNKSGMFTVQALFKKMRPRNSFGVVIVSFEHGLLSSETYLAFCQRSLMKLFGQ